MIDEAISRSGNDLHLCLITLEKEQGSDSTYDDDDNHDDKRQMTNGNVDLLCL